MADILVLGATGMLGHALLHVLGPSFDIIGTTRGGTEQAARFPALQHANLFGFVEVESLQSIEAALAETRPRLTVNCIGAVKQSALGQAAISSVRINALFPHEVADLCRRYGSRFLHISTDCVFSGAAGNYDEKQMPDPVDLYGRSKLLGEPSGQHSLTLRCSLIGRELRGFHGLLEWFLANRGGTVKGFRRAVFSGVTTFEMARIIGHIHRTASDLTGLWHVAGQPIDKCSLLEMIDHAFETHTQIEPDDTLVCDRSLNGHALRERIGFTPRPWKTMIEELASSRRIYPE